MMVPMEWQPRSGTTPLPVNGIERASPLAKPATAFFFYLTATLLIPRAVFTQVNYVARFKLEKQTYHQGEPIFCDFVIQNTGAETILFSYRFPSRAANRELEQEPEFTIKDLRGRELADPAPRPCGGARGSVVYGTVTLPPGGTHTERWLLNQWARFARPGKYNLRARRRLPLRSVNGATNEVSKQPVAFALALNELAFDVATASSSQLRTTFGPYARALSTPDAESFTEAFLVAITLPQPFFIERLAALARAPAKEHRWDPEQALEGLARLGTRAAWHAILGIAQDPKADESQRAYAVLLLGEKADPAFLSPLIRLLSAAPEALRDDILRALGFFNDPRANQALFKQLHSPRANDRVNAILGLRNLESKDAIPALLAMLNDPEAQVRQVANFALQSLTGQRVQLSPTASREESERAARSWHDWWGKHEASFVPARQPACHDW